MTNVEVNGKSDFRQGYENGEAREEVSQPLWTHAWLLKECRWYHCNGCSLSERESRIIAAEGFASRLPVSLGKMRRLRQNSNVDFLFFPPCRGSTLKIKSRRRALTEDPILLLTELP